MKCTIRDHFDRYQLSDDQLRRLRDIQAGYSPPLPDAAVTSIRYITPVAVLAGLMIAVIAWRQMTGSGLDIPTLAAEIAYHHNQRMGLEVESSSLDKVRDYLERLNFPLIESSRYPAAHWDLAGGRYCSLKGQPAAQMRLHNRYTGKTVTLYQLLAPPGMDGFDGSYEGFDQGVRIEIWKERGLLLAAARED